MPTLPRRRKAARRGEILAAAHAVFREQPYEQASMSAVAARAGCVVGTIYTQFRSKRELFDAVLTDFYDRLIAEIEPRFALLQGTEDRLRFLVARHLQLAGDDPAWLRVLGRLAVDDGAGYFGSRLHRLNRRYVQFMTRTIADGIARGELAADLDPRLARDLVFGGLEHWLRDALGRSARRDPAAAAQAITRLLLDGWRAAPAARGAAALAALEQRVQRLERGRDRITPADRGRA